MNQLFLQNPALKDNIKFNEKKEGDDEEEEEEEEKKDGDKTTEELMKGAEPGKKKVTI